MLIPDTELDVIYCPNCENLDNIIIDIDSGIYTCTACQDTGSLEDLIFCPSCESNHIVEVDPDQEDDEDYEVQDQHYYCYSCEHIAERHYELVKYNHKK